MTCRVHFSILEGFLKKSCRWDWSGTFRLQGRHAYGCQRQRSSKDLRQRASHKKMVQAIGVPWWHPFWLQSTECCHVYSTCRNNTWMVHFRYLIRWVDFYFLGGCSGGSNLRKRQGKSKPIFGDGFQFNRCFFCIFVWIPLLFVYFFKLCLLRAFYAFYQENHGLEVPRETRLEMLASPGGIEKNAWRKNRVVNKNYFRDVFLV